MQVPFLFKKSEIREKSENRHIWITIALSSQLLLFFSFFFFWGGGGGLIVILFHIPELAYQITFLLTFESRKDYFKEYARRPV